MWKVSDPPKRWQVGVATLIVSAPIYVWLILRLIHEGLSSLRLVIAVFWTYGILGFFAVKAILKRLASDKQ